MKAPTEFSYDPSPLLSVEEFQRSQARIFRTINSINWFIRRNRPALAEGGALLVISGRIFIDPDRFDVALRRIGAAKVKVKVKA